MNLSGNQHGQISMSVYKNGYLGPIKMGGHTQVQSCEHFDNALKTQLFSTYVIPAIVELQCKIDLEHPETAKACPRIHFVTIK